MAEITRPDKSVEAFASTAQAGERYIFGDPSTASDDLTANLNADFLRGWAAGLDPVNGHPPMEWFNAQMFTTSGLVSYLFQRGGIPEWNTNQEYYHPAFCTGSDNKLYASVQDSTGVDPVADGGTNWKLIPSEIATQLEAEAGIDNTKTMTPLRVIQAISKYSVELATSTEIRTGTDNTKAISPLGYNETTLGWGQSWQDVTASRSTGVVYTNNTGRPIKVNIYLQTTFPGTRALVIDGITFEHVISSTVNTYMEFTYIVPNGSTYQYTGGAFTSWRELR